MISVSMLRAVAIEAISLAANLPITGTIQASASQPRQPIAPHPSASQAELATIFGLPTYPVKTTPDSHAVVCPRCKSTRMDMLSGDASQPTFTACWQGGVLKIVERPDAEPDAMTTTLHAYVECQECDGQFAIAIDDRCNERVEVLMVEMPVRMRAPRRGVDWSAMGDAEGDTS